MNPKPLMNHNRIQSNWNEKPLVITGPFILGRVLTGNENRAMIAAARPKKPRSFWTRERFYSLALWIAFAGAFSGLAFVAASIVSSYREKPSEVWTIDAQGNFIPMKEKGK